MWALATTRAGAPACGINARIARASSPGRQWLSHEYQCRSRPPRPPPQQIVDFRRVKQRVWCKPPRKCHRCPFCKNKFTGREWLAHQCKERSRVEHGGMWLTPKPAARRWVSASVPARRVTAAFTKKAPEPQLARRVIGVAAIVLQPQYTWKLQYPVRIVSVASIEWQG